MYGFSSDPLINSSLHARFNSEERRLGCVHFWSFIGLVNIEVNNQQTPIIRINFMIFGNSSKVIKGKHIDAPAKSIALSIFLAIY